jgi:chromosome segregation ATPase
LRREYGRFDHSLEVLIVKTDENLEREIHTLEKKIESLEQISKLSSRLDPETQDSPSQILKRITSVQNLIDQIEIEIDKLEMRISAIEHLGFRLRTGGQ